MNLKSTIRFSFPLASAIAVILATQSTQAQNTWDGGGSNSNWTFSTNWSTDVTPTGTQWQEGIIWAGNVRNDPNNNIATLDLSVGGFSFTNDGSVGASNGFTVSGDRITLVGDITTTAASPAITDTISLAMILNGNRTITTNTSHNLTVSGIISESGGPRSLTKAGAATLTLSGANSYSGATNINAGTLSIGNAGALANTSRITIGGASAATLSTSLDGLILTAPITTADTGVTSTIAFSRTTDVAGSITLNGAIEGDGNVRFSTVSNAPNNKNQVIVVGAAGTYLGSTTITTASHPQVTNTVRNGILNALPTTTVLTIDGANGPSGNFVRTTSYDLNGFDQTLAGLVNIARTKRNQRVNNTSETTATLTIDNALDHSYGSATAASDSVPAYNAAIVGNLNLVKKGVGTQTLAGGANTYTGTTTVEAGTLLTTNASVLSGFDNSGRVIFNGGTLGVRIGASAWTTTEVDTLLTNATKTSGALGIEVTTGSLNQWTAFTTTNFGAALGLTKLGAGDLILDQANDYAGATNVRAGKLILANNDAAGTSASGIAVLGSSAAILEINSGITTADDIVFSNTNAGSSVKRAVATASAYDVGTSGNFKSSFAGGTPDTTAKILAGTSSGAATLTMSFGDSSLLSNDGVRRSDIFSVNGTGTDLYVLQLTATGQGSDSILAYNNGSIWDLAVTGNTGTNNASVAQQNYAGTFADFQSAFGTVLSDYQGAYGLDTATNSLWAVVNYGGSFAVVPEPTSALAGLLLGAGLLRRKRNFER